MHLRIVFSWIIAESHFKLKQIEFYSRIRLSRKLTWSELKKDGVEPILNVIEVSNITCCHLFYFVEWRVETFQRLSTNFIDSLQNRPHCNWKACIFHLNINYILLTQMNKWNANFAQIEKLKFESTMWNEYVIIHCRDDWNFKWKFNYSLIFFFYLKSICLNVDVEMNIRYSQLSRVCFLS